MDGVDFRDGRVRRVGAVGAAVSGDGDFGFGLGPGFRGLVLGRPFVEETFEV